MLCLERYDESRDAFRRALEVDPRNVRARFNLADYFMQVKDLTRALVMTTEGLLHDRRGEYRDRLLHKQAEILQRLAQREEMGMRFLAGRVNRRINSSPPGTSPSTAERQDRLSETRVPSVVNEPPMLRGF